MEHEDSQQSHSSLEQKKTQAADSTTSPALLKVLSQEPERDVRYLVVLNPATTLHCLIQLASEFPDEFLRHPLVLRLKLKDPRFSQRVDIIPWEALLRSEFMPSHWVTWICKSHWSGEKGSIWNTAPLHVNANQAFWERLEDVRDMEDRDRRQDWIDELAVITHQSRTPVSVLAELAMHSESRLRALAAESPALSPELARQLASDRDAVVQFAVASNSKLPPELQLKLAEEKDFPGRGALASNPALPETLFSRLAVDEDYTVRGAVARNPQAPEVILLQLASDPYTYGYVREGVAENPRTPETVLHNLASDPITDVRCAVASNVNTPQVILEQLVSDPESRVRSSVAENPVATETMLAELASDPHLSTRIDVARSPQASDAILSRLARDSDEAVQWWAVTNPVMVEATLLQVLADLQGPPSESIAAYSRKEAVLRKICWHPSLSRSALEALEANSYEVVRQIAARRLELGLAVDLDLPQEIVGSDTGYHDSYQALLIWEELGDPKTPDRTYHFETLLNAITKKTSASVSAHLLERWQQHVWEENSEKEQRAREILSVLFPHWELLPEWQKYFAVSPYWELRYWLTLKPETSPGILAKLTRDGHRFIRVAAQFWLTNRERDTSPSA